MQELKIVEAPEVKNPKNAIITRSRVYQKEHAKPGFVFYIWTYKAGKRKFLGAVQMQTSFEQQHGIENVKLMVIHNIVNEIK